jgi:hypothetical protein
VALAGNGTVIAGSDVDSVGPSNSRRFSTSASGAPRGMRTAIGAEPVSFLAWSNPVGEDTWFASGSQAVTVALYAESHPGTLRTRCYASGSSASSTSHTIQSDLQAGDMGTNSCLAVALDSQGRDVFRLRDDNPNGVQTQTFTTTATGRPRRLQAVTLANTSTS